MKSLFLAILILCTAGSALAASGIKGRIAWRGQLVPDVRVHAYATLADYEAGKTIAVSEPADLDGTYRLDLAPGEYHLVATDAKGAPKAGDHFCYYSNSPISVQAEGYTNVGFNLIRIPEEATTTGGTRSGITGSISFQDEPLERVYLYVYQAPAESFRGPAYHILPVEKGNFRLRLPPGTYYLLARKRAKGGMYGPIEIGDYFNFYHGNPVRISAGETQEVKIETITRLSMLEEDEVPLPILTGTIQQNGSPAAGLHVFAYRSMEMTGTPDYFSEATTADGRFSLKIPRSGTYYLLARESFGGPAEGAERYGRYGTADKPTPVTVKAGVTLTEVTIDVAPRNR